jgi:hypothetical protein
MLAVMHLTPIGDADVEPVLEQMGKRSHAEADAADPLGYACVVLPWRSMFYPASSFPTRRKPSELDRCCCRSG